jgi:hypothetical protein
MLVAVERFVEIPGCNSVKQRQIAIKHDGLVANYINLGRERFLSHQSLITFLSQRLIISRRKRRRGLRRKLYAQPKPRWACECRSGGRKSRAVRAGAQLLVRIAR